MAELHKFQDDVRSEQNKAKPIGSRYIDENFRVVRLKVASNLESFLRIKENYPQSDELELALNVPTSGKLILGFNNGSFTLFEVEEC